MLIYILLLLFILSIGICDRLIVNKNNKIHLLRFSCLVLFFVAAVRDKSVGADTLQYTQIFNWVKGLRLNELNQLSGYWWDEGNSLEYSYKLYNKIISLISSQEQMITIFNSFFLMIGLYMFIKNNSKDYWFSLFLFYALGFYQLSLNLTPSFIASLFVLSGWKYLNRKKWYKFIIYSLIALVFHTSAVAVILICILTKLLKLNYLSFLSIIIISFLMITFAYEYLSNLLLHFVPSKYEHYLLSTRVNIDQLLVLGVHALVLTCSLIVCHQRTENNNVYKEKKGYLWFFIFEFVFYCFAIKNTFFSRGAFLIAPFICITVPEILDYSHNNRITSIDTFMEYNSFINMPVLENMTLYIGLITCFQYVSRLFINNIGQTMPYLPFW